MLVFHSPILCVTFSISKGEQFRWRTEYSSSGKLERVESGSFREWKTAVFRELVPCFFSRRCWANPSPEWATGYFSRLPDASSPVKLEELRLRRFVSVAEIRGLPKNMWEGNDS